MYAYIVTICAAIVVVVIQTLVRYMGDRDYYWKYEWMMEAVWVVLFTVLLFWVMYVMKPD